MSETNEMLVLVLVLVNKSEGDGLKALSSFIFHPSSFKYV